MPLHEDTKTLLIAWSIVVGSMVLLAGGVILFEWLR